MASLDGNDKARVRFWLNYTSQTPARHLQHLEVAMDNIISDYAALKIVESLNRIENRYSNLFATTPEDLVTESLSVTGLYTLDQSYSSPPSFAARWRSFVTETDFLASALGANNFRTSPLGAADYFQDVVTELVIIGESIAGPPGEMGFRGSRGDKGDKGDAGTEWRPVRAGLSFTLSSLNPGESANVERLINPTWILLSITTNFPTWIRFYDNATSRTNDSTRAIAVAPSEGIGLQAEVATATGLLSLKLSPSAIIQSDVASNHLSVANRDTTARAISISLEYLIMEP